jgi:hypothetical protein
VPRARIVVKIDHDTNSTTKDFAEEADRIKDLIEKTDQPKGQSRVVELEIIRNFDEES